MKYILLLFMALTILSCSGGDFESIDDPDLVNVDEPLKPFFLSFKEEAAERGVEINYTEMGITGSLGGIPNGGVIGQCNTQTGDVTIDRIFWAGFDSFEREHLIYHELGHCALNRPHCDVINNNGTCFSIMFSNARDCDANYNLDTRELYIDELFDGNYRDGCE